MTYSVSLATLSFSWILPQINEDGLVPTAVTSVLGVRSHSPDPWPVLLAFLGRQRVLLVLDNCEHVIAGAAALTERLYSEASGVHILATSRELLRVEGEHVHKLAPLGVPNEHSVLTAAEALAFPAVQLFMERAAAGGNRIELSDAEARLVTRICRQLDGCALALELAAGRVGIHGIRGTPNCSNCAQIALARPAHRAASASDFECNARLELQPADRGRAAGSLPAVCFRGRVHPRGGSGCRGRGGYQ